LNAAGKIELTIDQMLTLKETLKRNNAVHEVITPRFLNKKFDLEHVDNKEMEQIKENELKKQQEILMKEKKEAAKLEKMKKIQAC